MDIKEKELSIVEDNLDKLTTSTLKLDSASAVFVLSSLILYTTSNLDSYIKLAFLGIEIKSFHGVYVLFILSLTSILGYCTHEIKKLLLLERYRILFREIYDDFPESLSIINQEDSKVRRNILFGRWVYFDYAFHCFYTLPFLLSYFYLAYSLVNFDLNKPIFELICSGLITVLGVYTTVLFMRVTYLDSLVNEVEKNRKTVANGSE